MGAGTPRGPGIQSEIKINDGPGIRPPKDLERKKQFDIGFPSDKGPGIRPPKDNELERKRQFDIGFPSDKGPGIRPPQGPNRNNPEEFDKLLENLKASRPAPGSNIPLGPNDRPIGFERPRDESDFITPYGDTRDPNYAEQKKAIFEKYGGPKPGFGDIGVGGGPGIPPRFPTGPRDPRTMRGPRKEAVLFAGKPPSTVSKKPTKGSPKGGMGKTGLVDTATKNKFEEMLAYMKNFQR